MIRTAAIMALAMLSAGGCAQSPAPEAFPQDVADAWVERYAANDAAGVAALETGKFMELWKKVDGKWLIHRDMWSSNAPPPATDIPPDEPA
jgi:hypothetical protein